MPQRKLIKDDLVRIRTEYDKDEGHLFSMWVLSAMHFGGELDRSTLEEVYENTLALLDEGGPGDFCLDGFFYDESSNVLHLYQTKWPNSAGHVATINDARQVANALTIVNAHAGHGGGEQASRGAVLGAFRNVRDEDGRIILRGVTGGRWARTHQRQVEDLIPTELRQITTVELLDIRDLQRAIEERTGDLSGKRLSVELLAKSTDCVLEHPDEGFTGLGPSVVTLFSARSLAKTARKHGQRLFEKNVRLYLGRGRVNKDMEETLRSATERRSFWYGHNGITILCEQYELTPANKPTKINMLNPQIVNGCQTATTLGRVLGDAEISDADDFAVLARIIKLTGSGEDREAAAEMIAYRTNSQAAVNDADLRANDIHQRTMQRSLDSLQPPWFYERKRGEWKNLSPGKKARFRAAGRCDRVVERDIYQQAWRAFTGHPSEAITKKNAVWTRGTGASDDLYGQVFDTNRRPHDVVLVATLFDWFIQVFSVRRDESSLAFDIHKGLKTHARQIRRSKTLVAAHSLALFGEIIRSARPTTGALKEAEIIAAINALQVGRRVRDHWSTQPKSWRVLEKAVELITQVWGVYLASLDGGGDTLYGSLKRPGEAAFQELNAKMSTLMQYHADEYATPRATT